MSDLCPTCGQATPQPIVIWRARCSCGSRFAGTIELTRDWCRRHDDSPLASHVVSWDMPGVKPWSETLEPLR